VLGEKNHLTLIPDIVEEYNKSLHNFLGIKYLTLVFGAIPSENQLIEIKKNLFTLFQMNEVVLQLVFDSSLLGGFIIYENSRKFDFSLKGKLQKIIQSI
jgi:F-type H+-transporting ATPase subunit delta